MIPDRREGLEEKTPSLGDPFDRREANRDHVDRVWKTIRGIDGKVDTVTADLGAIKSELDDLTKTVIAGTERTLNSIPNRDPIGHLNDHLELAKDRLDAQKREEDFKRRRDELIWGVVKYVLGALGLVMISVFVLGGKTYFHKAVVEVQESAK